MPFFRPPANDLDPYQLDLCASVFRQTWSEIVPRGCRLSKSQETRLQDEISQRLCALAAQGLTNPDMLIGLTVATVGLQERMRRQSPIRNGQTGRRSLN
jgi:hypothetical protein